MKRLLLLSSVALFLAIFSFAAQAQNAANNYTGSSTGSLLTAGNWSLGHVPTVSEDAIFTATTGIRTLSNGSLTVGSFDVTANTGTFTIRNGTNNTTSTLTLGGPGNLGNSVAPSASDLLTVASGATFTINGTQGTAAVLNLVLAQSGNFDAIGTLNVESVISQSGGSFGLTKTGAGALTLSGANTYSGGTTLSAGTLNINNGGTAATNSALGTGTFTIAGGTISNTSGAAVTLATNNAQIWSGNFSYAGTAGTNNLNFGTGAVTLTGNRQIIVNGTTSTLTVSGSIGDGGNAFSLTKATGGTGTLILGASNTYGGGTIIAAGNLTANADGALGTGNINLTASTVTLTLQNGAVNNYIANTASISIVSGAVANLNFTGASDIVSGITLGGVAQTALGTYGSTTSGAIFQSAFFSGTGTLTLIPEPATYMLFGLGALVCAQQFLRRKKA